MFNLLAKKIFGSVNDRNIKKLYQYIDRINLLEDSVSKLGDEALKAKTEEFKNRIKQGETLDNLLFEAFAVVREVSKRVLNMRHFDVQLLGGIVMHQGKIAEMKTGEGKTLVSTLPCYLNALTGKNVIVVTVNDYLAKRDSDWMGKIHEFLGLKVGCITNDLDDEGRKEAYQCDITYATNNELGFDYLRDNMKYDITEIVQRDHYFAIIDEVDSILIDEARTPLVISGPTNDNSDLYEKINRLIPKLSENAYKIEEKEKSVFLTDEGVEEIEIMMKKLGMIEKSSSLYDLNYVSLVHHVNQALKAHKIFKVETDYIVKDNSVIIIDEFTGRMQEGRRFSEGLHQALEAKENVKIKNENQTLASITFQNYFRMFDKLAGMTGTALTEAVEFEEIYGLNVVEIPTNKKISRIDEDDEIYKTEAAKNDAIVKSIEEAHKKGQPVLVGTTSVEKSEILSKILTKHKLVHKVLNAKYHAKEAEIISLAGKSGAITIATNMAGRGTDIVLGASASNAVKNAQEEGKSQQEIENIINSHAKDKEKVINSGGLYVLGSERHESRRIDNQLRGRSGRQGDAGRSKFYLSLEDDLMRIFGSNNLSSMLSKLGLKDDEAIYHPWITRTLEKAQKKVEHRNYEIRKNLLKFDDVVNYQRKNIFKLRNEILTNDEVYKKIDKLIVEINEDIVGRNIPKNSYADQWNIEAIESEIRRIYDLGVSLKAESEKDGVSEHEILDLINKKTIEIFTHKKELYGLEIFNKIQKQIYLITLDSQWKNHLLALDKLRYGINLRAYGQKDPLIEYKKEAYNLFENMMLEIEEQIVSRSARVQVNIDHNDEEMSNLSVAFTQQNMTESRSDPALMQKPSNQNYNLANNLPKKEVPKVPVRKNFDASQRNPSDPSSWGNIKRNELCPCNSGKKYKQCHGKK